MLDLLKFQLNIWWRTHYHQWGGPLEPSCIPNITKKGSKSEGFPGTFFQEPEASTGSWIWPQSDPPSLMALPFTGFLAIFKVVNIDHLPSVQRSPALYRPGCFTFLALDELRHYHPPWSFGLQLVLGLSTRSLLD